LKIKVKRRAVNGPPFYDIIYCMKKTLKGILCVLIVLSPLIILSPVLFPFYSPDLRSNLAKVFLNPQDNWLKNVLFYIVIVLSILEVLSLAIWTKFAIGNDVKNSLKFKKIFFWILFILFFVFIDWGLVWLLTQTFCGNCGSTSPLPVIPTLN